MPRTLTNRKEAKRLDGLIALPLARFRTAIGRLPLDELAALEQRLAAAAMGAGSRVKRSIRLWRYPKGWQRRRKDQHFLTLRRSAIR